MAEKRASKGSLESSRCPVQCCIERRLPINSCKGRRPKYMNLPTLIVFWFVLLDPVFSVLSFFFSVLSYIIFPQMRYFPVPQGQHYMKKPFGMVKRVMITGKLKLEINKVIRYEASQATDNLLREVASEAIKRKNRLMIL